MKLASTLYIVVLFNVYFLFPPADVEEQQQPGVGPAVFCGLGLTVGLLGVAAGTFFLIKGNECS